MSDTSYYEITLKKTNQIEQREDFGDVKFPQWQGFLMKVLKKGDHILDLGCGIGYYGKIFLDAGYKLTALDGAPEVCKVAEKKLGQKVFNLRFDEVTGVNCYDAVWACCSLLHVSSQALPDIMQKVARSLKPGGYMYATFKEGCFEGVLDGYGTYFLELTEKVMFEKMLPNTGLEIIELNRTPFQKTDDQCWLHFLMQKQY